MYRIKSVVKILQSLVVWALLSFVKPYGNKSEKCKALLNDEKALTEKLNFVPVSADKLGVEVVKKQELPEKAPPFSASEEIENQNGENACMKIVNYAYYTNNETYNHTCGKGKNTPKHLSAFSCCFIKVDKKNTGEKCPQNILMHIICNIASRHKIKGNFGQNCKQKKSAYVFFEIFCVKIAFNNHERKNRKGKSTYTCEPFVAGNNRCPKMVTEHQNHCHDVKRHACKFKLFQFFHFFVPVYFAEMIYLICQIYHRANFVSRTQGDK